MESNERSASAAGPVSEGPSNREPEELWDFDSLSDTASPSNTDSSDADSDSTAGDSVDHEEEPERAELDRDTEARQAQLPHSREDEIAATLPTIGPAVQQLPVEPIWQRTRARQPLTDVTIEELEALLQEEPLDSDQDEDEQYREFLRVLQGKGGVEEELPEDDDDGDFVLDWDELMALGEEEVPELEAAQPLPQTRTTRYQHSSPEHQQQPGVQWVPQLADLPSSGSVPDPLADLPVDAAADILTENGPVVALPEQAGTIEGPGALSTAPSGGDVGRQAGQGSDPKGSTSGRTSDAAPQQAQPLRRKAARTTAAACREALMKTFEALDSDRATVGQQEAGAGLHADRAGAVAGGLHEAGDEPSRAQPRQPKTQWKRDRQNPLTREQLNERRHERHASNPDRPRPQNEERPLQSTIAAQQRHALPGGVPNHVLREGLQSWYVATPGWSFGQLGHLRKQLAQHIQLLVMQNALLASSAEHLHHEALAAVRLMLQHILVFCQYGMRQKEIQRSALVPVEVLQEAGIKGCVPQAGRVRSLLDLPMVSVLPAYISDMALIPVQKAPPYVPPTTQAADAAMPGAGVAGQASAAHEKQGSRPKNIRTQRIAAMKRPIVLLPAVQRVFAAHCIRHLDVQMLPKRVPLPDTAWTSGEKELLQLGMHRLGNDCIKIREYLLPARTGPHVFARMQEAIKEGKKAPTAEPPLSQAEYEILKAAEAKTRGKDRWVSIAAQLPARDPDVLKKLYRKAQYEAGQQKHEAAMQRAAAKQLDLGGPLALLGGPDKGPFDDLVVGVLHSWAQPAISAHQGAQLGFGQRPPGGQQALLAQQAQGQMHAAPGPHPWRPHQPMQMNQPVVSSSSANQQPVRPPASAQHQPTRAPHRLASTGYPSTVHSSEPNQPAWEPSAALQPPAQLAPQAPGQQWMRPQAPVSQPEIIVPPAVTEQSQGIDCHAIMWLANEILAQGVACGLSASTSGISPSLSMQTQPNGQSMESAHAAPEPAWPQQAEMALQPSDGAKSVDLHASRIAHEQAPAQQQELQTGAAVPVCSGSTAQQSQPAGLHQPFSTPPTPGHMHSGGEGPPLSAALPDNAGSAVPACSGSTAQQGQPAGLNEPLSSTPGQMHGGEEGPLLSGALPDNAAEPVNQGPQSVGSPGEQQVGAHSDPGTEQDQPQTGSNGVESLPTGGRPAAETPRKARLHRKKNPPQSLSKTHRSLAKKPVAPGVPPPHPTSVSRGLPVPGLMSPSQPPIEEPQHQETSGPRQAAPHGSDAEPPRQSQPIAPPVQRSPRSAERQNQKGRQLRRAGAPCEELSPGKIPRLRNLNLISGPSRLTGSPTNPGRAGRPRTCQAEVGGARRLSLSPSAKKQRTGKQTAGEGEGGSVEEADSRDYRRAGSVNIRVVSPIDIHLARPQQPRRTSPRQLAAVQPFSPQLLALAELATDGV